MKRKRKNTHPKNSYGDGNTYFISPSCFCIFPEFSMTNAS